MKRSLSLTATAVLLVTAVLLLASPYQQAKAASKEIAVLLDGLPMRFDVQPQITNGRTMVPFRFIAEALNINVSWESKNSTISASDGKKMVLLQIDNKVAQINGLHYTLDAPPVIIDGRTLIPLRFFSEAFACRVEWNGEARTIRISSPPRDINVIGFYALGAGEASSWLDLFGVPYPQTAAGNTDVVRELALGWYTIDEQGNLLTRNPRTAWLRPPGWEIVLAKALEFNLKTEMVVHETNHTGLLTAFLNDEQAMSNAINSIFEESVHYGGVNLNLEELGLYAEGDALKIIRESFTRFVAKLSKPLKDAGKNLTITIHPPNSSFRGYDYAALGQLVDRIIIMAHDYGPKPEPLSRVIRAVEMAISAVPREKLVLAISAPSETEESIIEKIGVAKRFRLQGISLWRLGLVTNEMWAAIRQTVATRSETSLPIIFAGTE